MTARDVLLAALCAGITYYLVRDVWRERRQQRWVDRGIAAMEHLLAEQPEGWR